MSITFKGKPLTLHGSQISQGQQAPDFTLVNSSLEPVSLSSLPQDKILVLNVVPSLDTPVCATQSKTFFEKLSQNANVELLTISKDLPFAQARFCGAENIQLQTLSDYKDSSFGKAYGLLIEELQLLTRAVIVLDQNKKVQYLEIVPEVTNEPNYGDAVKAIDQLTAAAA